MKSYFKTLALPLFMLALFAGNALAQTRTLYFLPPSTPEWTLGESYLVWFQKFYPTLFCLNNLYAFALAFPLFVGLYSTKSAIF
ncbi:MAG: hypothetical protein FWC15_07920, partial [Fibromonadales bacterium]|nr:hypothetical protein [Fibromonadales bacterium]